MRNTRAGIIRNVMTNWGAYILATLINFFLSPYVVHHLGKTGYGVWTVILSLTGYLGLLDLGVRGAVTRYVAKFHTESDDKRASNVASSAMLIFASGGVLAVLASIVFAGLVVGRMQIPPQYIGSARAVLVITGLSIAASLVNGVFGGILAGLQRFDLTNGVEVLNSTLRGLVIVTFLHLGYGIVTLALIQLGFTVTRLLANVLLARRYYPELKLSVSEIDSPGIRMILSYAVFSFLLHVSGSLIFATDNIVIASYLPVAAVTFFGIAGNLTEYTRSLVAGISQTMMPLASSTEAKRDDARIQHIVLLSSRASTMVVVPIALTFFLRGSSFIRLWMGEEYADLSGRVLRLLSVLLLFWAANSAVAGTLLGLSKHKPLVPAQMAEGLCNFGLSIYWVQRMGIEGVALGTIVPGIAFSLIFWPWYIKRTLHIPVLSYAFSAWVRPMIATVPFALASYAIERYWVTQHLFIFFAQVLLVLPLAILGYWVICLEQEQRQMYFRKLCQSFGNVFVRTETD